MVGGITFFAHANSVFDFHECLVTSITGRDVYGNDGFKANIGEYLQELNFEPITQVFTKAT